MYNAKDNNTLLAYKVFTKATSKLEVLSESRPYLVFISYDELKDLLGDITNIDEEELNNISENLLTIKVEDFVNGELLSYPVVDSCYIDTEGIVIIFNKDYRGSNYVKTGRYKHSEIYGGL